MRGTQIRVRGLVQGVGFRPTVWRLAHELGLHGDVRNDGSGVLIRVAGDAADIDRLGATLRAQCPPLARIDSIECSGIEDLPDLQGFTIVDSDASEVRTGVVPDAATCSACAHEIKDPGDRRYRYPFTNCTHCGPRLSIVQRIPYDRANTSMSAFTMCPACNAEYHDPADRRFHAQPNACPACGPRAWLVDAQDQPVERDGMDAIALAGALLQQGAIIAIKGIGGFHLACDACNAGAVDELRRRKRRFGKPFALMARDVDTIRRYVDVDETAAATLRSSAAPIVLLRARAGVDGPAIAAGIAPGQALLGFMLPYSPLHQLLLADWRTPLVMTSGNLSDEPQCTDNDEVRKRMSGLADCYLLHDRAIVNRVDDSVVRIMQGRPRLLRRARGYAPAPIRLPDGFTDCPPVLALGGELKNTICLLKNGEAIISQHLGDLEDARTADAFEGVVSLYSALFEQAPQLIAVDLHPDYRSTRYGHSLAENTGKTIHVVQHHHAHIASVLADNGWPVDGPKVLGVALDGLGLGSDGTLWGGEFLLADYRGFERLAHLKPTAMPGGTRAILEPWRNTYAHIVHHIGQASFEERYGNLALAERLRQKPCATLAAMMERGINSPLCSSYGRLFDAVAGALDVSADAVSYEGQAAIELEALAAGASDGLDGTGYVLDITEDGNVLQLDPAPMWQALLQDLANGTPRASIAARFHQGLADSTADLAAQIAQQQGIDTIALSGGVMQNALLFERIANRLDARGLRVLSHQQVPANDGGLSLGQAVVAAASRIAET
ncbi:MAG: carbamoyltransferase HypF [Gammaproteobacteria bacterium]|nr:carbamoyltransferase HypF [Gammaproteobacteria bacterium]